MEEARLELRGRALNSLYFFCKAGLGFKDMKPYPHGVCCDFIQDSTKKRKLLQKARGHLKSSIATRGKTLWLIARFLTGHDVRNYLNYDQLIACSTARNAYKFSLRIENDFLNSPMLGWWFPEIRAGNNWSRESRTFVAIGDDEQLRTCTVDFIGVGGRVSSSHYRRECLDDMHASEEAEESAPAVADVCSWYAKTDSLLIEPELDEIDVIGTNCSILPPDVYLGIRAKEADDFDIFVMSCYKEDGKTPVWPERFPASRLAAIRRKMGDYSFSCNYLNNPIDPSVVEFTSSQFQRFFMSETASGRIYKLANGKRYREGQLFLSATVDLAGWRGKGDSNAILVHGRAADGMNIVINTWKKRCTPTELLETIAQKRRQYHFQFIGVEEVAYQQCLSHFLEEKIVKEGWDLQHAPVKPKGESTATRVRAMEPYVRQGQVAVADNDSLFWDEVTRFPKWEDHLLACWSYQPQIWQLPALENMDEFNEREEAAYLRGMRAMG
jgi:hypothetical protein